MDIAANMSAASLGKRHNHLNAIARHHATELTQMKRQLMGNRFLHVPA